MTTDREARIALAVLGAHPMPYPGTLPTRLTPAEVLDRIITHPDTFSLPAGWPTQLTAAQARQKGNDAQDYADHLDALLITPDDEGWPQAVADLPDNAQPWCLWTKGAYDLNSISARSVAITGARAATAYGQHVAEQLAADVTEQGWTVAAGAAYGIDAAAHRGALGASTQAVPTMAVLAFGIDRHYPLAHAPLLDAITAHGVTVTPYKPGTQPTRALFQDRTQLLAALTRGTVLVEAGQRSTSALTHHHAGSLRRVQMAVPGPVSSAQSLGTNQILKSPDVRLITGYYDIIEALTPAQP
ncbi:DNA-processing protein DprA [Longispora sp. NPDC051575]|uniref:DNA-processing protein DprA n=1 Tax=Longispora sp. NPDC051575 TaxID=3154943 RepID=UPI00342031B7